MARGRESSVFVRASTSEEGAHDLAETLANHSSGPAESSGNGVDSSESSSDDSTSSKVSGSRSSKERSSTG